MRVGGGGSGALEAFGGGGLLVYFNLGKGVVCEGEIGFGAAGFRWDGIVPVAKGVQWEFG